MYHSKDPENDQKQFDELIKSFILALFPPINAPAANLGDFTLAENPLFAKQIYDQLAKQCQYYETVKQFENLFLSRRKPTIPSAKDYASLAQNKDDIVPVAIEYIKHVQDFDTAQRLYMQYLRRAERVRDKYSSNQYVEFVLEIFSLIDQKCDLPILTSHHKRRPFLIDVTAASLSRHMLITGSTGSGKTNTLKNIIFSILHNRYDQKHPQKRATIIFDPHGNINPDKEFDFYNTPNFSRNVASFPFFEEHPDDIMIIDPFLYETHSPHFLPFERPVDYDNALKLNNHAIRLMATFEQIINSSDTKREVFTEKMPPVLLPILNLLLHFKGAELNDLLVLLQDERAANRDPRFKLLRDYAIHNLPYPQHAQFFTTGLFKINTLVKETLQNRLINLINDPFINQFFSAQKTFDLEQAIDKGKTIIFSFQRGNMERSVITTIGQFLVYQITAYAFRRSNLKDNPQTPISLILDECEYFTSQTTIEILKETRKYGLSLILATQQLGQIQKNIKEAIITNTGSIMAGKNKDDTAEIMAKSLAIKTDEIINLKNYRFWTRTHQMDDNTPAIKLTIPKIEDDKPLDQKSRIFTVGYDQFQTLLEQQKQRFYRPLQPTAEKTDQPPKQQGEYKISVAEFSDKQS